MNSYIRHIFKQVKHNIYVIIMREWQVGDPIGEGNDAGVPDIPYMGYLNKKNGYDNEPDPDYENYYTPKIPEDNPKKVKKPKGPSYETCISRAREYSQKKHYRIAIDFYDMALDKRPNDMDALIEKAECLHELGRDKEASQCYYDSSWGKMFSLDEYEVRSGIKNMKKAVELDPDNDRALVDLGHGLRQLKKYSEAISYYERVKNENVNWHMAMCYKALRQYPNAIELFDKCLEERPDRGDWLYQKCECLVELNRMDEAIAEYRRFIDDLISNRSYDAALRKMDEFAKILSDDEFTKDRREKCLKKY